VRLISHELFRVPVDEEATDWTLITSLKSCFHALGFGAGGSLGGILRSKVATSQDVIFDPFYFV
jgi:hypothetical protein